MKWKTPSGKLKDIKGVRAHVSSGTQHNPSDSRVYGRMHSFSPELLAKEPELLRLHSLGYTNTGLSKALGIGLVSIDRMLKNNGLKKHSIALGGETGFKVSPDRQLEIVKAFDVHRSKSALMRDFSLSFTAVCQVLSGYGVDHWGHYTTADDLTEPQVIEAIKRYQEGESQNEVCRRLGLNAKAFTKLFDERGVEIRGRAKHALNSAYFDRIDTFYKAYFLGWLAADGSIGYTRGEVKDKETDAHVGRVSISIQERDGYVIDKLREELAFSGEVKLVDKGPGRQKQCRLGFCDQHMAQTLYRYGLTPNKSFSLRFPDLPKEWVPAFILGYFDGDGSVLYGRYTTGGYTSMRQRFDIIASPAFAETLLSILKSYGIEAYRAEEKRKSAPLVYVKGSSRPAMLAFYRFLYAKAPFCLQRKRDKFVEILKLCRLPHEV